MANATRGRPVTPTDYIEQGADLYRFERQEIDRRRRSSGRKKAKVDPELKVASDLTGLALSGGGVRSAATCLGAIQALHVHGRLKGFDYLSTVSGGGYIGARLSVALAAIGGRQYPFGEGVSDSPVVSYLRDYSNYLMPRSRSLATNLADGAVIVIRGLIANAICILAFLLPAALLSAWLFVRWPAGGGALAFLFDDISSARWGRVLVSYVAFNLLLLMFLALGLWAALRAFPSLDEATSDTESGLLRFNRLLLRIALALLLVELQPVAVSAIDEVPKWLGDKIELAQVGLPIALSGAGAVATFASSLGNFLKRSEHQTGRGIAIGRGLAKLLLYVGAAILPLLLWLTYLVITDQLMKHPEIWRPVVIITLASVVLIWFMRPNGYSLHGFYRDRLSKAFLIDVSDGAGARKPKLSDLKNSDGPYPLINAALNIQGSATANQRGREADFFVFTPDYVGSQLTGHAPTVGPAGYETIDPRIDIGSAIAISGAAVSANMGSHTVRVLSPTLSLLNVRLGYWIKNPRKVPRPRSLAKRLYRGFWDRAFLLTEMFNRADEHRDHLFISDGGHIENLGIYQLLRRKCGLILAVDAEADPNWSCSSLLKLERYARIDLGVRIEIPWEQIAAQSVETSREIREGKVPACRHGPHCAVGPIYYGDGSRGVLIYVKSSLTGDEKDYVIDYARRYPSFPHETTSDQFFSEEQFEMYRALGFHMVNRFFRGDQAATVQEPEGAPDAGALRRLIDSLLPGVTPAF